MYIDISHCWVLPAIWFENRLEWTWTWQVANNQSQDLFLLCSFRLIWKTELLATYSKHLVTQSIIMSEVCWVKLVTSWSCVVMFLTIYSFNKHSIRHMKSGGLYSFLYIFCMTLWKYSILVIASLMLLSKKEEVKLQFTLISFHASTSPVRSHLKGVNIMSKHISVF